MGSFPETYNEMIQRIPPCERNFLYLLLDRGREKDALPKLRQSFEVAAARTRGIQRQFSENICLKDDLKSRIFGTFVVKFLACLPLLGFSNI